LLEPSKFTETKVLVSSNPFTSNTLCMNWRSVALKSPNNKWFVSLTKI